MSKAWERELVLLTRLFQEELGRLPCALVMYMHVYGSSEIILTVWQNTHKKVHKPTSEPPTRCVECLQI